MKRTDLALAAVLAMSSAAPAFAADQATNRPTQLTQKADDAGKNKAKATRQKADADKDKDKANVRTNKGGAMRGDARSDQVQDMNKKR